jgi:serine/threonine protein phosphatase PrpC
VSPGKQEDEIKNQDSAAFYVEENIYTAILCDGVSTSFGSREAAEYIVSSGTKIFTEDGLHKITQDLCDMREKLLTQKIKLGSDQKSLFKAFCDILREKRKTSYQSTLVAVQWIRLEKTLKLRWLSCGDSGFFVFSSTGKLLLNNLGLQNENSTLPHPSITEILPDSYNIRKHFMSKELVFPIDTNILLCSDGLYDGFKTFKALYEWIYVNYQLLQGGSKRRLLMSELHDNLQDSSGDDDISLVLDYQSDMPSTL